MSKKMTVVDEMMNRKVLYGGLPVRYSTVVKHMGEVAKSQDPKDWMRLRDAGLIGFDQGLRLHPERVLPDDATVLSYEQFVEVTGEQYGESEDAVTSYKVGKKKSKRSGSSSCLGSTR